MKQKKESILRRSVMPALALLLAAAFLLYCGSRVQTRFPELHPRDGVLDAQTVDFSSAVYHLVNSWDYYPGQILFPDAFADPASAPEKGNGSPLDAVKGTWRLRIRTKPDAYLSLCSFSIDYSTRIFVNGAEVRNIGFVSDDPAQAVPSVRYVTLPLYSGSSGEIEIIYQYANYVHNEGGFIQNTLLSTPENIDEYQRALTLYSLSLSSGLMFLLFYFLLCAALQKSREYAALALCCLVIAFRNQFFFAEHLLRAGYDFAIAYRFVVLDVSLIPASAFYLLAAFFPGIIGRKAVRLFSCLFLILSALHFIVDTHDLVLLCHICYYVCAPLLMWAAARFIRHFIREKHISRPDALTLTAILFFIVMLIWEGVHTGSNSTVNHFGVTPMAMVICILLLAIVINSRIQQQTVMLRQAQERNVLLGRVNEMNRDFLRTVAHELKTPLTVISGYAQLIERQMERHQLSGKTPERLQTIHSEADRLGDMVTRLMDYTYGKNREAEMATVDAQALLNSAEAIMTPVCLKRQNTLVLHNRCSAPLHGNQELLLQVLINLIVNAAHHTEAGQITVEAREEGAFAVFSVSDTGSGISPEDAPHIFEKGYTTDEGRGLGLAICRETVALHGGELSLVSTGPQGSVFRFTVPKEEMP